MGVLRGFCRLVDAASEYTARVAIWGVLALVFILTWEVLLRSLFNMPTIWAHESTQYFFGFYFALGGAYCLKMGGMVRVDTVIRLFRPRTRAVIEGVTGLVALIFMTALVWTGVEVAWDSIINNERSISPWGPPIYPLKIIAVLGSVLLGMQSIVKFLRDLAFGLLGKEL
ncbi:MAG: TRAP transporter small permease subunit [candidate division NC10 bacterium]|nr:TRAP transporter small permease subunit [candidate division NC10 bacterium]MBI2113698.1 TRAP transporter small permease subunit [candidate division NC10 bacterium]MBI3085645.1 TRAP transporter small permease subunit [candidate division NC10 bacterium]